LRRTITMCILLDVVTTVRNSYTMHTFRCGLYLPELTLCIQSGVGCIAQNCYTVCTFSCGLYPELLLCAHI